MAERKLQIVLELVDRASQGLKSTTGRLEELSGTLRKAGLALSGFGAGGLLTGRQMVDAFLEQERAMRTLGVVVEQTGQSFEGVRDRVLEVTAALQRKTGVGDEEQIRVLTTMVPILGDVDKALEALPAAMDLAAVSGLGLEQVARSLAEALAGQSDSIARTGIEFEKGTDFATRLQEVLGKVGGAAEANANPFAVLGAAVGDLSEKIGGLLLPMIEPLLEYLGKLVDFLQTLDPRLLRVAVAATAVATAFATLGGPLLLFLGFLPQMLTGLRLLQIGFMALGGFATSPIGLTILAITGLIAAGYLLYKNWDAIWPKLKRGFELFLDFAKEWGPELLSALFAPVLLGFRLFIEGVEKVLKAVQKIPGVGGMVSGATEAIETLQELVDKFTITGFIPGLGGGPGLKLASLRERASETVQNIKSIGEGAKETFQELVDKFNIAQFIPGLQGGAIPQPALALLGERWPETMAPPHAGIASQNIEVNLNGPVFGEADLQQKIVEAVRDAWRAGGLRFMVQ